MDWTTYNNMNAISMIFDKIVELWKFKIQDLDGLEYDKLKAETLHANSIKEIWKNKYRENMVNILNCQIETNAPIWILCNTCWYLLDSLVGDYDFVEINLLKSAITLLSYINKYWSWDRFIQLSDDLFDGNDNENVLSLEDGVTEKEGNFNAIWSYLIYAYLWRNRYEWEKVKIEWDFCDILRKFYDIVWQDFFVILYWISKYEVHSYCLERVLYENNYKNLYYIYSPKWLSKLSNHPILKHNESKIVSILEELKKWCMENFWGKYSPHYIDFLFDSAFINIFRNLKEDKQIKTKLIKFLEKYEYIDFVFLWNSSWFKTISNGFNLKSLKDWEKNFMISQWLYFKFIKDQIIIKEKLEKMDLKDFKSLFTLMHGIWQSNWYLKCKNFFNLNNKLRIYWEEFELSRLFLYQKIWKEQFDWLHSIYEDTIWEPRLRNLYNLVIWKFSLAFMKYWVDYFTEWYLLFLKQVFKNIWLQTPYDWLENFNLPKEKWNDFWILELDNEEILSLLLLDESLNLEYKASFSLNWKVFLKDNREEECQIDKNKIYPFLKPIVSMLNSHGWSIIVGAWEKLKVEEAIKKWEVDKNNISDMVDFNNNLYLTGVDRDFNFFWGSEDNLKQNIDKLINDRIDPSPNSVWSHIEISFYSVAWRKICLLEVPNVWDTVFFLKEKKNNKDFIKKLYIRNNANDEELKDPEKIVNFTKSKIGKW